MNSAKLRRSRDVSKLQASKIERRFIISHLAMLDMGFCAVFNGKELARQATDTIAKLLICGRPRRKEPHISSGRDSTASLIGGVHSL